MNEYKPHYKMSSKISSERTFGLVFAAFFFLIALFPLLQGGLIYRWAIFVSSIFLILALLTPALLRPLNRLWARFGIILHSLVSPIVLGIIFFIVVTPTGLLTRLFGMDSLRLRKNSSIVTYWINRDPPGPASNSFDRQF